MKWLVRLYQRWVDKQILELLDGGPLTARWVARMTDVRNIEAHLGRLERAGEISSMIGARDIRIYRRTS